MTCPRTDEIIADLDGELSLNRHRGLTAHLERCTACATQREQLVRLTGRLRPDEGELEDAGFVAEVMQRVEAEAHSEAPTPRRRPWLDLRLLVPALAVAATVLVALLLRNMEPAPPRDDPRFLTRGSAADKLDRWVSLWVYQRRDGAEAYAPVRDRFPADARLVFGYRNSTAAYRYLMVFAFDRSGEVFWYYPAYETRGTDPASIAIRPGRHELRDEIQHDFKPGAVRIMALFSQSPLRVSQVERAVKQAVDGGRRRLDERAALPLPGTGQTSRLLRVLPGAGAGGS